MGEDGLGTKVGSSKTSPERESVGSVAQSSYVHRKSVTSFLPPLCATLLTPATLEIWAYESSLPPMPALPEGSATNMA